MQRIQLLSRASASAFALAAFALVGAAAADDGRREISQACALAGCFDGDSAGFPVTLATAGSYVLTSRLTVLDVDQPGISIQSGVAGTVAIDLNGFEIVGPVTCTGENSTLSCGAGAGIGIVGSTPIAATNGRVTGFGGGGIAAGAQSRVDGVVAEANGGTGIAAGPHSVLRHCIARRNLLAGILVDTASIVDASAVADNVTAGMDAAGSGVVVRESTAYRNASWGVSAASGAHLEGNAASQNYWGLGVGSGGSVIDSASYGNQLIGISTGEGAMVSRNTARSNGYWALFLDIDTAFNQNTLSDVLTVTGGVSTGANYCSGIPAC